MNTHDELTRQLGDRLREEVSGVGSSTVTLDDVRGTATRIRRRRAAVAGAGVAAVIALVVPTAIGTGVLRSAPEPPPAQQPVVTPEVVEVGSTLDTGDLPMGGAAEVPWLEDGRVLHVPGAEPIDLGAEYTSVVRWRGIEGAGVVGDGWLARTAQDDTVWHLHRLTGGRTDQLLTGVTSIAVSGGGDRLLFGQDGALRLHDNVTGETVTLREGLAGTVEPIGVTDDGVAHYNVTTDDGTTTAYRFADGQEQAVDPGTPKFTWNDVSDEGWTLATTDEVDVSTCSRATSPSGDVAGESCEFSLDALSADSERVLTGPSYQSGYGDTELAVLRTDDVGGTPLVWFRQRGADDATFMDARWEDEDSALVVTTTPISGTADKTWQLLRVNLDGTVENVAAPMRADEFAFPFRLLP